MYFAGATACVHQDTSGRYKLYKMMLQFLTLGLLMTSILAQSSSCGGTLYGSGYIRSPNYPSNYDNNLGCNWTIIASPYNRNIVLQFLALSTESCCDFVSIYDNRGTLVHQYSGTYTFPGDSSLDSGDKVRSAKTLSPSMVFLGSRAVVSFTTDHAVVSSGFAIWFSTPVPCSNYTILNESWRNVYSPLAAYHCDYNLAPGTWYRFMSPAGVAIPEAIPPRKSCGTQAPMWLNGAHPRNASGDPVDRMLCANWNNDPCWSSISVKVALCPGGFYVYMTPASDRYCYDVQTAWCAVNDTTSLSPRDSCEQQGFFYCDLSNLCIASWRRCDGFAYCYYGEDEAGCVVSSTSRAPATTPGQRESCIGQGNFYCELSGECIAMWRRCDGYAYCYYGEDETGCSSTTVKSRPASTPSLRDSCERQGNFYCAYSGLCVTMSQRCNGYFNCYYGEDESGCVTSSPVTTNTGRTAASVRPQERLIAASGFVQAFLQLSKSSTSELPQGRWNVVSGYVLAWLLGHPRLVLH